MANYVCSDIHGFYNRYITLLEKLILKDDDTLFILGDAIDRGPDGIKILQDIMKRKNIVFFIGNHEYMMLDYLNDIATYGRPLSKNWLRDCNGGRTTLSAFEALSENEKKEILEFLNNSYLQKKVTIDGNDFMLCHTFYNRHKKDLLYKDASDEEINALVWYSPFRDDELFVNPRNYEQKYTFIVGHVPTLRLGQEAPLVYQNIINIDGGCAISAFNPQHGNLCCIKLDEIFDLSVTKPFVLNIR